MSTTKTIFTVSRLNGEVRRILEKEIGEVWLSAEISNFSAPSSGHWYLTLKDHFSQIRCAMFKGRNRHVSFRPANGQQVLVKGNISVYEPRGDYQLIIDSMQPAGDGLLSQQFEALKMQLAADGLFATDCKQPLPSNIQRIGVITSPTGAAIRDVLHVLNRRDPSLEIIIYPAQVQGEQASLQIRHAIETANERQEVDVLLLTRGGGSLEDLWCFNDELLAHTIFNSELPIVSAIGHEVDTTISDYVADVRAPTPSAGAELLSNDTENKQQHLQQLQQRLNQSIHHLQLAHSRRLEQLSHRLQRHEPEHQLQQWQQRFDEMQLRLTSLIQKRIDNTKLHQYNLAARLQQQSPEHQIRIAQEKLGHLNNQMLNAISHKVQQSESKFQQVSQQLELVSPLATLTRGYSITTNDKGKVVTSSKQVGQGDVLRTKLSEGELVSTVTKVN
ncbi:exodeoxyribonuclease VII large subunit [Parashewanella tropica]|uniref:exodeoxyribonuclease VII large subunit n=1 Tax=Parashewanella tropica TaxID=2547970 RepID=UPI001FE337BA|nr:exodeoxyribonuclease VII large subunit [Parashewanella tropica]